MLSAHLRPWVEPFDAIDNCCLLHHWCEFLHLDLAGARLVVFRFGARTRALMVSPPGS